MWLNSHIEQPECGRPVSSNRISDTLQSKLRSGVLQGGDAFIWGLAIFPLQRGEKAQDVLLNTVYWKTRGSTSGGYGRVAGNEGSKQEQIMQGILSHVKELVIYSESEWVFLWFFIKTGKLFARIYI